MTCTHYDQIRDVSPSSNVCDECIKMGERWVHLRMCLTCGNVGCCDSSKNKHARQHYHQVNHPVIESREPNEDWRYCFVDDEVTWMS